MIASSAWGWRFLSNWCSCASTAWGDKISLLVLLCLARPISFPLYPNTIVNDNYVRTNLSLVRMVTRPSKMHLDRLSDLNSHCPTRRFSSSYLLSMEFLSLQVEMEKTYGVWGICGMSHLRVPFSLVIKSSLGANSLQSNNKDADVPFIWFSIIRTIMVLAWRERLEFRELGRLFSASMT